MHVPSSSKGKAQLNLSALDRLATRPWLCGLALAGLSFSLAAALDLAADLPAPGGHDEASYVLAADTYAAGRLANPTHPHWQHFETFHVIHEPTYVSKYPPMQGLVLAAGQVLFGHPAAGIWLGAAFMCVAIYWMLLAWLPPRWALLGGVFALGQFGIFGYWAHTYWGGAVAAAGGALVLGSMRRIVDTPSALQGLVFGAGLAILANSRPVEGLLLAILAAAPMVLALRRRDQLYRWAFLARTVPPLALVLALCGAWMGYYNWRTTGSPLRMPYQIYAETYSPYPLLQLKEPGPMPDYRHDAMRDLYETWEERPLPLREPIRFAGEKATMAGWLYVFYLGVFGLFPMLALGRAWKDPWVRYAGFSVLALVGFTLLTFAYPHYLAPATGLVAFVAIAAARRLPEMRWRSIDGSKLLAWTMVLFTVGLAARLQLHFTPLVPNDFERQREEVRRELEAIPGDHLVIVRYVDGHLFHNEWVFNRADIDGARVVWARDMGGVENAGLVSYFDGRTIWLLEAGKPEGANLGRKEEVVTLAPYGLSP